jgi:membrane-associated phospholipid phosphatase
MGTRQIAAYLIVAIALLTSSSDSSAQSRDLRWSPVLDPGVVVLSAAGLVLTEAFKPTFAPSSCRWCEANEVDSAAKRALQWNDTAAANTASNWTAFALAPAASLAFDMLAANREGALRRVPVDALIIAEAGVVAADLTEITKFLVARERPFVHDLAPNEKQQTSNPSDNNLSFVSGHTAEVFALAAATGTVATMRGYRWAPAAWIGGGVIAAGTGYLRIAAAKHWLTDVLAGMALGVAVGVAVPLVFHKIQDDPTPAGAGGAAMANSVVLAFPW